MLTCWKLIRFASLDLVVSINPALFTVRSMSRGLCVDEVLMHFGKATEAEDLRCIDAGRWTK